MDARGAQILRDRIAQQQHWELAEAVRDGRQSRTDPDRDALEDFGANRRVYGAFTAEERTKGHGRRVTRRLVKVLRDGEWVVSLELDDAAAA